jgi:hypothetical protein
LEFLAIAITQEGEINEIQIGKEFKPSVFVDDMILCMKDLKNATKNLLEIINTFIKVAGYKINSQKPVDFLYTNNEQTVKEYRKTIPFTIASKKKIRK